MFFSDTDGAVIKWKADLVYVVFSHLGLNRNICTLVLCNRNNGSVDIIFFTSLKKR